MLLRLLLIPAPMQNMLEHEYLPLIPKAELRRITALLQHIYTSRGWANNDVVACDAAWQRVLQLARSAEGGAWSNTFDTGYMTPSKLSGLAEIIDREMLGGLLQAWLRSAGKQAVVFAVVDRAVGGDDWISYFNEVHNTVVFLLPKWSLEQLDVAEDRPISCEGLLCTSRLEVGDGCHFLGVSGFCKARYPCFEALQIAEA